MKKKDFHRTITVSASSEEAMKKISQVNLWWAKDFSGKAEKLNDKFTIRYTRNTDAYCHIYFCMHRARVLAN